MSRTHVYCSTRSGQLLQFTVVFQTPLPRDNDDSTIAPVAPRPIAMQDSHPLQIIINPDKSTVMTSPPPKKRRKTKNNYPSFSPRTRRSGKNKTCTNSSTNEEEEEEIDNNSKSADKSDQNVQDKIPSEIDSDNITPDIPEASSKGNNINSNNDSSNTSSSSNNISSNNTSSNKTGSNPSVSVKVCRVRRKKDDNSCEHSEVVSTTDPATGVVLNKLRVVCTSYYDSSPNLAVSLRRVIVPEFVADGGTYLSAATSPNKVFFAVVES